MLSAGERPQPPLGKNAAVMDMARSTPVSKSSLNHATAPMWTQPPNPETVQHIWVVTGPAGCGKSTVGRGIQQALQIPFLEGDDVRCRLFPISTRKELQD